MGGRLGTGGIFGSFARWACVISVWHWAMSSSQVLGCCLWHILLSMIWSTQSLILSCRYLHVGHLRRGVGVRRGVMCIAVRQALRFWANVSAVSSLMPVILWSLVRVRLHVIRLPLLLYVLGCVSWACRTMYGKRVWVSGGESGACMRRTCPSHLCRAVRKRSLIGGSWYRSLSSAWGM